MYATIGCFNVNGLIDKCKRTAVFRFLENTNSHIILLQETHSSPLNQHSWQNEWTLGQSFFHSLINEKNNAGVAILLKTKHMYMEKIATDLDARDLTAKSA